MRETLIKVEGLYKKFSKNLRSSMLYAAKDISKSMLGMEVSNQQLQKNEFWALQDINFELKRGEVLGLIGRNGSGKTTLLRLLSGIFPPNIGRIEVYGRIGALIAVGAGFHPHMTGRENIFLNGVILGMSSESIKSKLDEIVDFAEIGDFIDAPVSTYSSGMRARLGFAIAVHSEPDILLIDEVLSVGDVNFRKKSMNKIYELIDNAAIIFVSHSMPMIMRISDRLLLIENSRVNYLSTDVESGVKNYYELFSNEEKQIWGEENIKLQNFLIKNSEDLLSKEFNNGDRIVFEIFFELLVDVKEYSINFTFTDQDLNHVAILSSITGTNNFTQKKECVVVRFINQFAPGKYTINVNINEMRGNQQKKKLYGGRSLENINIISSKIHGSIPIQINGVWQFVESK